jgi:hypothetical protein
MAVRGEAVAQSVNGVNPYLETVFGGQTPEAPAW